MRWLAGGVALIVAVAALVLALDGTLSHTSHNDSRVAAQTHTEAGSPPARSVSSATTPTSPTLAPPSGHAVDPTQQRLHRALDAALRSAGPDVGVLVYDISSGSELYAVNPRVGRPPASLEKLWTTTALIDRLGPSARLKTAVLGTGRARHGVWRGNLYLRGGGDPTFGDPAFNSIYNDGHGSTPGGLVAQLYHQGIRRVTGSVYADESQFDRRRGGLLTDYKADVPDFGGRLSALVYDHGTTNSAKVGPAQFAVRAFVTAMRTDGIEASAARRTRTTPRSAQLLATESSPPLSVMLRLMNVRSDDLFAELFAKQLGVLFGGGGTITEGARVIAATVASHYALHPTILDGSGLGRDDRTSPLQLVDLLRDVWHTPDRGPARRLPAHRRGQRDRRGHRREDPRAGALHRQDRLAERRLQPRRLLHDPGRPGARVRHVPRRARQRHRLRPDEPDGRRDRAILKL